MFIEQLKKKKQFQVTGTKILFTEDRDPGDTTLEFEIATLASDGSGFSGGKPLSCSFLRLCHREGCEVLREQPEQQARSQPGDVRPALLQETHLHSLDAQPNL